MTSKTGKLAHALTNAVTDAPRPPKKRRLFDSSDYCEWFALCTNHCTKMREHPVLGRVPICERCDKKVEELS